MEFSEDFLDVLKGFPKEKLGYIMSPGFFWDVFKYCYIKEVNKTKEE